MGEIMGFDREDFKPYESDLENKIIDKLITKDKPIKLDLILPLRISNMFEKYKDFKNKIKAIHKNEVQAYAKINNIKTSEAYVNIDLVRNNLQGLGKIEQPSFYFYVNNNL